MFEAVILTATMLGMVLIAAWAFCLVARISRYTGDDGGVVSGYSVPLQLITHDNAAVGIRYGFYLLAFVVSFWSVVHPSGVSFSEDLNLLVKYGLLIMALLLVSGKVNDDFILSAFNNNKEVISEKNVSVATVEAATYLATAMILSGALAEWQAGYYWSALLWCGLGQVFLIALYRLYSLFNKNVSDTLDNHKMAPALALGGFLFAGGMVLGAAISGPSHGFLQDVFDIAMYVGIWIAAMGVTHWTMDLFLVPGTSILNELYKDDNAGIGVLTGLSYVAITFFYTLVW